MATWREVVDSLASRVQRPYDENLKNELYHIINYKRAQWLHRTLEQYPNQRRLYLQSVVVPVERVDASECTNIALTGCKVLKTKCKVPAPLRSRWIIYDYVGDPNGNDNFTYTSSEAAQYMKHSKYTADVPRWFYSDGYVYIYNTSNQKSIKIRGVFEDATNIENCGCSDTQENICFNPDEQIQLPADILSLIIKEILSVELAREMPVKLEDEKEVTVDEEETKRK